MIQLLLNLSYWLHWLYRLYLHALLFIDQIEIATRRFTFNLQRMIICFDSIKESKYKQTNYCRHKKTNKPVFCFHLSYPYFTSKFLLRSNFMTARTTIAITASAFHAICQRYSRLLHNLWHRIVAFIARIFCIPIWAATTRTQSAIRTHSILRLVC